MSGINIDKTAPVISAGRLPLANHEGWHHSKALDAAFAALAPSGRLAVLSYHSLEDRMVKERFAAWSSRPPVPRGLPVTGIPGEAPPARLVTRGAARPSAAEVAANPRAESARLRVLERVLPGNVAGGER